jgi:hypothetical protein
MSFLYYQRSGRRGEVCQRNQPLFAMKNLLFSLPYLLAAHCATSQPEPVAGPNLLAVEE